MGTCSPTLTSCQDPLRVLRQASPPQNLESALSGGGGSVIRAVGRCGSSLATGCKDNREELNSLTVTGTQT